MMPPGGGDPSEPATRLAWVGRGDFVHARRNAAFGAALPRDLQKIANLLRWTWSAEEIALDFIASMFAHELKLLDRLNPLRGDDHSEFGAKARHCPNNRRTVALFIYVLDKTAIDFDFVERERSQIA